MKTDRFLTLLNSANENIPLEIVVMHIRAFLENQEREYFADFDGRIAKFSKSD